MRRPIAPHSQAAGALRSGQGPAETWVRAWRLRWVLAAASLIIIGTGANIALMTPVRHVAEARLAYAIQTGSGTSGQDEARQVSGGAGPASTNGLAADAVRLTGVPVADAVADRLRLARVFPELASLPEGETRRDAVRAALLERLTVAPGPGGTLDVRFRHPDREVASTLLSTWLDAFEAARAADDPDIEPLPPADRDPQPAEPEAVQAQIAAFQERHGVRDPVAAQARLLEDLDRLTDQRRDLEVEIDALEAEARALGEAVSAVPPSLPVPVPPPTVRAPQAGRADPLSALRLARETLLERYRPESRVIGAIETEIARLEAATPPNARPGAAPDTPETRPEAGDRDEAPEDATAPNPAHQRLSAERAEVLARLRGARQALAARQAQIEVLQAERARLDALLPAWRDLSARLADRRQSDTARAGGARSGGAASAEGPRPRLLRGAVSVDRQDPRPWILLISTLLAGLVVLFIIAAERRTARTAATPETYGAASDLQVLAVVPRLSRATAGARRQAAGGVWRRAKGG